LAREKRDFHEFVFSKIQMGFLWFESINCQKETY
jgi:hypothetical protein